MREEGKEELKYFNVKYPSKEDNNKINFPPNNFEQSLILLDKEIKYTYKMLQQLSKNLKIRSQVMKLMMKI